MISNELKTPLAAGGIDQSAAQILNKRLYSERWNVSTRTTDNWLRLGLPHIKLSARMIRICAPEADAWLRERFGQQRRGKVTT